MTALLAKPSTHHAAQAVFSVRKNGQLRLGTSATPTENGPQPLLDEWIEIPDHRECFSVTLARLDPPVRTSN